MIDINSLAENEMFVKVLPEEGVNVRKLPNEKAELLQRVNKADVFFASEEINNWVKINITGSEYGYIYKPFLDIVERSDLHCEFVKVKGKDVNVRELPDGTSPIVTTYKKGTKLKAIYKYGMWICIETKDGKLGFMYSELLDLGNEEILKYENAKPEYALVKRTNKSISDEFLYDSNRKCFTNSKLKRGDKARIMCTGDLMCEQKMYQAYNYNGKFLPYDIFYYVRKLFQEADFVVGNLETMVCEEAPFTGEQYKIKGKYHCNAPDSYLDILKYAGFDMFAMANNHNLDCGVRGIAETIHRVESKSFLHTGLYTNPDNINRYIIVDLNGIKVAFLSYSTWFNRNLYRLTEKGQGLLNIYVKEKAEKAITAAKKDGADFIMVYMHWGVDREYKHEYGESQKQQAKELAEAGADYIIGSHTHSLQGFERIETSKGKTVPVAYSLGNFATSEINKISRTNAILSIELKRVGKDIIENTTYIPCYVFDAFNGRRFPIVPAIEKYNENSKSETLADIRKRVVEIFDLAILEYGQEISDVITRNLIIKCAETNEKIDYANDEKYTCLRFAQDAVKGCAAFVPITSNPNIKFSEEKTIEMADKAIKNGARILISNKQIKNYPCIIVENVWETWVKTHLALKQLFKGKTVGITGSIGKTATTGMIYSVVSRAFETHGLISNANTVRYSGISLQQLKNMHTIYIQEIMEGPPYGCAKNIAQFVKPDISVITKVGSSHMEAFGSKERIAESCFGIEYGMPINGKIVINADDYYQYNFKNFTHDRITYGINCAEVNYKATKINQKIDSLNFNLEYNDKSLEIKLYCIGKHNIYNALAAFAVAKEIGMEDDEIVKALANYRTSGIRQNYTNICGQNLLLDCYNASSESIKGSLEALDFLSVNSNTNTMAILGDILELGETSEREHSLVGKYILESNIDIVVCYGKNMKYAFEYVESNIKNSKSKQLYYIEEYNELIKIVEKLMAKNLVILLKGSRGMALECVIDDLLGTWLHEEFERDEHINKYIKTDLLKCQEYLRHVVVVGGETNMEGELIIVESINGKDVTGIEKKAFANRNDILYVEFPKTLKNIRSFSFYKCNEITEIVVPSSVYIIDESAFGCCENLREVIIEQGIKEIRDNAFENCKKLKDVYLPDSICNIGKDVFVNCAELTLHCKENSVVDIYAKENNIKRVYDDDL